MIVDQIPDDLQDALKDNRRGGERSLLRGLMGSVSRVFSAMGGLFLLLLVLSLFLVPAVQTITDPDDADFPGGRWGIAIMLLGMASVPGTGAVLLFRRALRATETPRTAPEPASAAVQRQHPPIAPSASTAGEDATPDEAAAAADARSAASAIPASVATVAPTTGARRDPLVWMTRLHPTLKNLVGTSFGRGVLTTLVSVPLMIVWRDAAPTIGPMALTIFSLVDPLPMAAKPSSWWLNAFVSGTVWFVLFIVTAATADIVSDQPDIVIGFILPMMIYPAAMTVSALIRLTRWLSR